MKTPISMQQKPQEIIKKVFKNNYTPPRPGIRGTQVKSSVRMKKMQDSSK